MGGVLLCDKNCEVSFELGQVNAFFPIAYHSIISLIWNADFQEAFNTFPLRSDLLERYDPLTIAVGDLVLTWPTKEHAYPVSVYHYRSKNIQIYVCATISILFFTDETTLMFEHFDQTGRG